MRSRSAIAGRSLVPWPLFAAMIAAAGLPIYIHAPKFFVDEYGVSLAALGGVLALLRLIDVVQDPALGWLAQRFPAQRGVMVAVAAALMAAAMVGLFAHAPPIAPLLWFAITLTVLFSAYSFLTIVFYAQGVGRAEALGAGGHVRLAGWRETGSLIGVCFAATAPTLLATRFAAPFAAFAVGFAGLALIATFAMRGEWRAASAPSTLQPSIQDMFRPALRDPIARNLLILALMNAAPVAVTSTLFLFFVESRLEQPTLAGVYLLAFFLAAALTAPLWSRLAARYGERRVLLAGMVLSIASFLWAITLGAGDGAAFAVICLASGAALGADMVLLPALFARRMADLGSEAAGFGLWSFVSKLSLALAAAILLPALQWAGFTPSIANSDVALWALSLAYAGLPCALKLIALAILARMTLSPQPQAEGSLA
jgi:GPH family glycoside/pentoside/hexuronide:cation symporter